MRIVSAVIFAVVGLLASTVFQVAADGTEGVTLRLQQLAAAARPHRPLGVIIQTVNITMRDGVKLWTLIADVDPPGRRPSVLIRSPYTPDGTENLADLWLPFGFVAVQQNQRGTGNSQGNFTFWETAPDDEEDTITWIKLQDWSDGNVFVVGASADGINMEISMRKTQQEKGQWAIFTLATGYDAPWINGALLYALAHSWLDGMQKYRPNAPNYFSTVLIPHEGYSAWWAERTVFDFGTINFPAVHTGGWSDIFLQPMVHSFNNYQYASNAPGQSRMLIDPRGHCITSHPGLFPDDLMSWFWSYETSLSIFLNGSLNAPLAPKHQAILKDIAANFLNTTTKYKSASELDTFTFYIMGPSPGHVPTEANKKEVIPHLFNVTGLYWSTVPNWPEPTFTTLFLRPDGSLLDFPNPISQVRSFIYNPANPVPTVCGNNLDLPCGPCDQRDVENRTDVAIFTSQPFAEDTAVVGNIKVRLFVSSNCSDTDFTVKITDVYPVLRGEASVLLGDSIMRMRWRNGVHLPPQNMTIGKIYEIEIELWPTAYIFNKGHRVRLAVSSSNSPRFSANPNNGMYLKDGGPMFVANNTLHMGALSDAGVILPVVPLSAIPKNTTPF